MSEKKTYKLDIEFSEAGKLEIKSKCNGFTAFELLGLLSWKVSDIQAQLTGAIKPDIVDRIVEK